MSETPTDTTDQTELWHWKYRKQALTIRVNQIVDSHANASARRVTLTEEQRLKLQWELDNNTWLLMEAEHMIKQLSPDGST